MPRPPLLGDRASGRPYGPRSRRQCRIAGRPRSSHPGPPAAVAALAGRADRATGAPGCRVVGPAWVRWPPRAPRRTYPQLLHHQPRRPREVDPVRPHPRADRCRRPPHDARAVPRLDGHRAGTGDHHQGPERAGAVEGPHPPPHRHPRPRGLRVRGQPVAGRLRGGGAAGRRLPGHPGPDPGQLLPGPGERPRDRGRPQQDRSPRRRPRAGRGGDRAGPRAGRLGDPAHLGQDRPGGARAAGRHRGADPRPGRRPGRAAAGPDLRLGLRPVPGGGQLHPGDGGDAGGHGQAAVHAGGQQPRDRGDRHPHPGDRPGRRARTGRGRLPHRRHQGRGRGPLGRDGDHRPSSGRRRPRRLPRPEADGVLRAVPHRRRRAARPARRPGEAAAQRRQLHLRAGVVPGAGLRLPVRLPRPVAHGDRPRAPRAGVRPLAHRHRPVGGLPGLPERRHPGRRGQPERAARPDPPRPRRRAHAARPPSSPRPSTPARSWSCARAAGPRWSRWSTSRPSGSSSST